MFSPINLSRLIRHCINLVLVLKTDLIGHYRHMPDNNNFHTLNLHRTSRDMVRKGTIEQINGDKVRVLTGSLLTDWIKWSNPRAGKVKIASRPSIGEQVILFSENGNLNAAVVSGSINSDMFPMPEDCGENDLILDVPPEGRLVLRCGNSSVVMTADHIEITATRIDFNEG